MKKTVIITFLIILSLPVVAKIMDNRTDIYQQITQLEEKETWQKVGEHIYFNPESTDNTEYGYVSGKFKQYNLRLVRLSVEHDKYKKKIYAYTIISTGAFCDDMGNGVKKLDFPIYQFYDVNGKLETGVPRRTSRNHPRTRRRKR